MNSITFTTVAPVWDQERCRISAPRFLAECRKKRLNQDSVVLLCFTVNAARWQWQSQMSVVICWLLWHWLL